MTLKIIPGDTTDRSDGWKAFRVEGVLDFSLVGILSSLSGTLADGEIGIFAISTFNTDYILIKADNLKRAVELLESAGHVIE